MDVPGQIVELPEMLAVMPLDTVTVTLPVSAQLPLLTITEYVVLVVGVTVMEVEVEPVVQEYVVPPLAVSVVLPPVQIVVLGETAATIEELIFTITVSVAFPQEVTPVQTYVVVVAGVATGFEIFGLLNPVAGDHAYDVPPDAESVVLDEGQIVTSGLTEITPFNVTVTTTG